MSTAAQAPQLPAGIDLDMLAVDLSEVCAREEYGLDVCCDDIMPALRAFLLEVLANAAANEAAATAAAAAADDVPSETETGPRVQTGPAPEMAYLGWFQSQGVELGAQEPGEHYWRCPVCQIWVGPYPDPLTAKKPAMDHRWEAHDRLKALRSETAKVVRKVTHNRILIAQYDGLVDELAMGYNLDILRVHQVVGHVAGAIDRYSRASDLLFGLTREGPLLSEDQAERLAADVAAKLGHVGWLTRHSG